MPNCSSACCSSCSIRSAAWALATSSRCSASVRAVIRAPSSLTSARALVSASPRARTLGGQLVAVARGHGDRRGEPAPPPVVRTRPPRRRPSRRAREPRGRAARASWPPARLLPRGAANPPVPRTAFARSSAVRTASRASTSAARAASAAHRGLLTVDRLGVQRRCLLRVVQPGLELGQLLDRAHPARLELVALR